MTKVKETTDYNDFVTFKDNNEDRIKYICESTNRMRDRLGEGPRTFDQIARSMFESPSIGEQDSFSIGFDIYDSELLGYEECPSCGNITSGITWYVEHEENKWFSCDCEECGYTKAVDMGSNNYNDDMIEHLVMEPSVP